VSIERLPQDIEIEHYLVGGRIMEEENSPEYCCNNLLAIRGEGIKVGIKI